MPPMRGVSEGKIQPWHRDRLAVVYVRQSTRQQVLDHGESTRLQYGLVERAVALGWSRRRVLVIDEDLGRSGASAVDRTGFQRLVTEVTMDHVGLVLGIEMSRLARAGRDWHQLLELCALSRTLLADADGIYDPNDYNDRMLLGLKGVVSEVELHLIKTRMRSGVLAKASRGELTLPLPMGFVRRPSGEVVLDPDEGVQEVIRLVFRLFTELGTVNAVLRALVAAGVATAGAGARRPGQGRLGLAPAGPGRRCRTCCATRPMPGSTSMAAPARTPADVGPVTPTAVRSGWLIRTGWSGCPTGCPPTSRWTSTSGSWPGWRPTGPGPVPRARPGTGLGCWPGWRCAASVSGG